MNLNADHILNIFLILPFKCTLIFQMHLFDVDVPGKISFQESKSLAAGNSLEILDLR